MLEKAIVASANAAQSPDRTRRTCAFGRKTLRSAENIGAHYNIFSAGVHTGFHVADTTAIPVGRCPGKFTVRKG